MPGVGSEKQPLIMPDAARACRPAAPALPGLAGQQRLELARAVQRPHVLVAADLGVADQDLRPAGPPGQRPHLLTPPRLGFAPPLVPFQPAPTWEIFSGNTLAP